MGVPAGAGHAGQPPQEWFVDAHAGAADVPSVYALVTVLLWTPFVSEKPLDSSLCVLPSPAETTTDATHTDHAAMR